MAANASTSSAMQPIAAHAGLRAERKRPTAQTALAFNAPKTVIAPKARPAKTANASNARGEPNAEMPKTERRYATITNARPFAIPDTIYLTTGNLVYLIILNAAPEK